MRAWTAVLWMWVQPPGATLFYRRAGDNVADPKVNPIKWRASYWVMLLIRHALEVTWLIPK